jgi:hypothetical protein
LQNSEIQENKRIFFDPPTICGFKCFEACKFNVPSEKLLAEKSVSVLSRCC